MLVNFEHCQRCVHSACNRLQLKCASVLNQKDLTLTPRSLYKDAWGDGPYEAI